MPRYRRIISEIEAERITVNNIARVAEWCRGKHAGTRLEPARQVIFVNTNHGEVEAVVGDWIIRNMRSGEFYPCDDETFLASYEKV